MLAPQFPAGEFQPEEGYDDRRREELIAEIERAPALMRQAVAGLSQEQLDTRYRNWTVRQIVHHLTDSHVNCYVRFKWALTEDTPTIKPYNEGLWSELPDARKGDIAEPLALLDGLHRRWVQLLRSMDAAAFARTFHHPESGKTLSLAAVLPSYAWHGRHHTGQILWLQQTSEWGAHG
jgi:uncharacterized damage-inducible protein DinB